MKTCLICDRIELIGHNKIYPFVMELKTGYMVFGDHQFYRGYTLFLCNLHKNELSELDPDFRRQFLWEMSVVAEAVVKVFQPVKMNYELLGNSDSHMHWHLYPRHADDPEPKRPVWVYPKEKRLLANCVLSSDFVAQYKTLLTESIKDAVKKD